MPTPGMQGLKLIDQIPLQGRRVFLRCDFNVPLEGSTITDPFRIDSALPTIQYALSQGAKLILSSHLGRPKGDPSDKTKFSLLPVGEYLQEKLGREVILLDSPVGEGIKGLIYGSEGQVFLLENSRFDKGEEKNSSEMANALASITEVYINDAFGAAHRAHATTQGLPAMVKEKGIGFLMKKEIEMLDQVLFEPKSPFVAVLGGAKVSDKIKMIDHLLSKIDVFVIGGAMAYTFLVAKEVEVGASLVEKDKIHLAKEIIDRIRLRNKTLLLPVDHVLADGKATKTAAIGAGQAGFDIGPKTIELYRETLSQAKTIFWNGPMGMFEKPPFEKGSFAIAKAMADSKAVTVVGGGDSAACVKESGLESKMTHISTGGGASLEYLEGAKLPGIEVLREGYKP